MESHDKQQISLYLDGELDDLTRLRVEAHLAVCEDCRGALEAFAAVNDRARMSAVPVDRVAARRALRDILLTGRLDQVPVWRRRIPVPTPALVALVALVAVLVTSTVLLATRSREVVREASVPIQSSTPPSAATPLAPGGLDSTRFDSGNRLEMFVVRHERGEVAP